MRRWVEVHFFKKLWAAFCFFFKLTNKANFGSNSVFKPSVNISGYGGGSRSGEDRAVMMVCRKLTCRVLWFSVSHYLLCCCV